MRSLLVATLTTAAVLLLAVSASSAEVNPRLLVLQQADVPAGFRVDRDDSGLRTNEQEAKADRRLRGLFRRWERVTGYEMEYDRGEASISSRADLFRAAEGARLVLAFFVVEFEKSGIQGLRRTPLRIGAQGWLYAAKSVSSPYNVVIWRHDRTFAGVAVFGLTKPQTLALAHAQQRRIAAVIR